ncbi:MAG: isoprenylcysteine carboxylmethyltransferase family protein [Candidatus Aminicenantes bacterium]|jgi:protein-S-isoprenylcysteine O-methyltransferase Ste14
MLKWKIKVGNVLFKWRSFTPIPLIALVFIIFKPVNLQEKNILINLSGIIISFLGETIRIFAVGYSFTGTSGRETFLRADALNTTGIYSIVRNPLYIGNFLMFTGIVIVFSNVFAVLVFVVFLILQYYFIILSEESFLKEKYAEPYESYCSQVRCILPTFKNYKGNQNPFSLKKVIFKENDSIFNMLMMFLLVLLYKEWRFTGRIVQPILYIIPGGILIIVYVIIKILKKKK